MGCSMSGLNAMYDSSGADVWVNESRFRVVRRLGDGGPASVLLVRELAPSDPSTPSLRDRKKSVDPSHFSPDNTFTLKKVLIQNEEQLDLVQQEICVSSQFNHPNLLPLLDHAIINVKGKQDGSQNREAFLVFPVPLGGTMQDILKNLHANKEYFLPKAILQIFRQLCAGLQHMHTFNPPHAHNGIRPDNVLLTKRKEDTHIAILMDFESARPARRAIRSQSEALQLKEWASKHCHAPYRAPELWDCPSHADIDERTDIWSLGCLLYAMMHGMSPFEYEIDDDEGSLQKAIKSAEIKWPPGPNPPYPDTLRQFITWMLQPQPAMRPHIGDVLIHVDKLISKYSTSQ